MLFRDKKYLMQLYRTLRPEGRASIFMDDECAIEAKVKVLYGGKPTQKKEYWNPRLQMDIAGGYLHGGKSMEVFSLLLMIAAIVCALSADKIDTIVKGDKKVKKVIVVFSVGVLLVCTIAISTSILS